jgi:hypothetical protein
MPACPVAPEDGTGVVIFFACLDLERKSSLINGLIDVVLNIFPYFSRGIFFSASHLLLVT